MVRKVAKEEGKPICILADLQGPKIRTGKLVDNKPVLLTAGKRLVITPETIAGNGGAGEHGVHDAGGEFASRATRFCCRMD